MLHDKIYEELVFIHLVEADDVGVIHSTKDVELLANEIELISDFGFVDGFDGKNLLLLRGLTISDLDGSEGALAEDVPEAVELANVLSQGKML